MERKTVTENVWGRRDFNENFTNKKLLRRFTLNYSFLEHVKVKSWTLFLFFKYKKSTLDFSEWKLSVHISRERKFQKSCYWLFSFPLKSIFNRKYLSFLFTLSHSHTHPLSITSLSPPYLFLSLQFSCRFLK